MPRVESTEGNFHLMKTRSQPNALNSHLWVLKEEEKTNLKAGRWKKTLEGWSRAKQNVKEESSNYQIKGNIFWQWNIIHTWKWWSNDTNYWMDKQWKCYSKWKKPDSKVCIIYSLMHMISSIVMFKDAGTDLLRSRILQNGVTSRY